jgi:pyridoxine/pyridoxamine 5'-phosphate oxidase
MGAYGIPVDLEGALPWSWAAERLDASRNFWISTADAAGIPHAAPVWGVWLDGAFLFDTGDTSKKARNVATQPRIVVTTERADETVILQGVAERVADDATIEPYLAAYEAKYGARPPGTRYLVRPSTAFGFIEEAKQFGRTATRWNFG